VDTTNPDKVAGILTSADILLTYTKEFAKEKLSKNGLFDDEL
jgi:hypothetical protein